MRIYVNEWTSFLDPPSFTTKPSDRVVLEGTEITFHCAADGNPVPEIKWMKDGKTVATQGLLIFEAMRNQSGKYWCSVENGLNSTVNASATLDVQCKWECCILLRISMDSDAAGMSTGGLVFVNAKVSCSPKEMKFSQAQYWSNFFSITNAQQLQVWYFSFTLSPACVLLKSRGWSVEKEQSFSGLCFVIESFFLSLQFPCINLSKYLT